MDDGELFEAKVRHSTQKQPTRPNQKILERLADASRRAREAVAATEPRREGSSRNGKVRASAELRGRPARFQVVADPGSLRNLSDLEAARAITEAANAGLRATLAPLRRSPRP